MLSQSWNGDERFEVWGTETRKEKEVERERRRGEKEEVWGERRRIEEGERESDSNGNWVFQKQRPSSCSLHSVATKSKDWIIQRQTNRRIDMIVRTLGLEWCFLKVQRSSLSLPCSTSTSLLSFPFYRDRGDSPRSKSSLRRRHRCISSEPVGERMGGLEGWWRGSCKG